MSRAQIDHEARENILASAMIRAAFLASRGLDASQACNPPGFAAAMGRTALPTSVCDLVQVAVCAKPHIARHRPSCAPPVRECQMCDATDTTHRVVCEQLHPGVCEWLPADDTEGGAL